MGPSRTITFRGILPALAFIVALNLSYIVLKGPTRSAILAYRQLWNAMFLAFPLAHLIARRASLRELGYRGRDSLRLYARGAAVGGGLLFSISAPRPTHCCRVFPFILHGLAGYLVATTLLI